ncbi:uncharacterized protein LOC127713867 [Mytilus californianus]|uniref:uncharacterized protein LOC127713867 n=1 Tax=Mytilus californianus TaxID=6549 RepID=UPI002247BDAF|nr:uncharacterized protein LOC127713867 [Mytilus californianus]
MYICNECSKSYKTRKGLQNHACNICQLCRKTFPSAQKLKRHNCKQQISNREILKCQLCKKEYSTENRLRSHKCSYCQMCSILFSTYQKCCSHICQHAGKTLNTENKTKDLNMSMIKNNTQKTDEVKNNTQKTDEGKNNTQKTDEGKNNTQKTDEIKNNKQKTDEGKNNTQKTDKGKNNTQKTDEGKNNTQKTDEIKNNTQKTDEVKNNSQKTDKGKYNTQKTDEGKNNMQKTDEVKNNTQKTDEVKNNTQKTDEVKNNTQKTDKGKNNTQKTDEVTLEKKIKENTTTASNSIQTNKKKCFSQIVNNTKKLEAKHFPRKNTHDNLETNHYGKERKTRNVYHNSALTHTNNISSMDSNQDLVAVDIIHEIFQFKPINLTWQMKHCTNLGLRFEKSSYPLYDLTAPNIIGNPKDLKKIIGDGNCFYRAISYAITGTETNHIKIRSVIVNHIHQLGTNLHSLLQHGQTCFSYVLQNQINIPGSWATEVEIFVASDLLRTNIFTYVNTGNNSYKWNKFDANYLNPNIRTDEIGIYLNHTNGNHYDIVLSTSTVHKTLACGFFAEKREHRQPKNQESEKFGEKKIRKKEYMRKFMQMRRSNTDYAEKERIGHQNRRLESKFKHFEVDYNKKRRTDPEFVAFEKEHNKKRRSNPEFITFEKEHNKKRRSNPEFVAFEKELNKKRRTDPEFVAFEKELNKKRRTDPEFVTFEKEHNKKRRSNPEFVSFEKDHNKNRRTNPIFLKFEKDYNNKRRSDPTFKAFEHDIDRNRNSSINKALDSHQLIDAFQNEVSTACIYRCTSCDQLWFKESVEPVGKLQNLKEPLFSQCVRKKNSIDGFEYVCRTCLKSLKKGKLPNLAIHNKLNFPLKPQVLMLNSLEEKLVAPVSTFFQMRELPSGGQFGIQGNVVNVPADNMSTVKMLPRRLPESQTIPVKLKRRLRYKSHVMFQNIRPQKCIDATKYLLTKPLFKQYVTDGLDEKWLTEHMKSLQNTDWDTFIEKNPETNNPHPVKSPEIKNKQNEKKAEMKQQTDITEEDDLWSEYDDDFLNKDDMEKQQECDGIYDTMLYPENLDSQRNILSFAPSEGNLPVSPFGDAIEELSFPGLFCGEKRPSNKERSVLVKYSEICKSELRQNDRRAAQNITNIFFKAKKIQMKQIQDKVWLSLRRVKTKGKKITAKDLKDESNVDTLVKLDDGYRIFRTLRGSPPYWESAKKDLFAMVRQLGLPTWFISLSSAETRWKPLLRSLGKIIDGVQYSDEDINTMTWQTKCRLVRSDPVTTARYFDYKVQKFFHSFLNSSVMPLGKVKEIFYRIEFQQRGSPHVHSVLWIENAPFLEINENKDIEDFISKYITTNRNLPVEDGQQDLVKLQMHRHTHTCRKKKKKTCRFNFPLPPMKKTIILDKLPSNMTPKEAKRHTKHYELIQKHLAQQMSLECSFAEFLKDIKMTEDDYILAIRSSLKETKVFLKRDPECIRINGYNDTVLQAWMANMDIQFVTNAFACLMYIVNYVSKGQRGMSNLLRRACEEAHKQNSSMNNQVKTMGNKFLKHVEISAQEAVYIVLQMKLKNSSCGHIFINTSPPDERPFIIKPNEELQKLPDNSTDVQCNNVIKRYSQRPKKVETICLADFAAWYDLRSEKKPKTDRLENEEEIEETDIEDNLEDENLSQDEYDPENDPKTLKYRNGVILKHRKKKKVIRYVRYSKTKDPENFHREKLLLFHPWRKEERIIYPFDTYADKYNSVKEGTDCNATQYEHHAEEIEEAEQLIENELEEEAFDEVAPVTQHIELKDEDEKESEDLHQMGEDIFTQYDIANDLQCTGTDIEEEKLRNRLTDTEFRNMARSLNQKQMEFFYHVLNISKSDNEQFMLFLSGGAGVGKTRLTKCIYQALIKYYNTTQGENPNQKSIILAAPTGKAAYLVGGVTMHAAFGVPANQGFQYRPLKHELLNTFRHQLEHLQLIIIDEISMCGSKLFCFINQRMQEIMGVSKPFGGINIITIGDLFQLRPVMDSWIFKQPSGNSTEILSQNVWKEKFMFYELTDIMRQKNDKIFAETLNRIREGNQTVEDVNFLKTRVIKSDIPEYPTFATHLLYHNKSVDMYNNKLYNECKNHKVIVKCKDIVIGDISAETKEEIKQKAKDFEMGLSKICGLAVGMRTELTVNIDLFDGLVNGAAGVIKDIECVCSQPDVIWVNTEVDDDDDTTDSDEEDALLSQLPEMPL